jgi:hypothetical protein
MDKGTRRFLSVVVVAMLLLTVLVSALMLLPTPGRNGNGGDDYGWVVRNETIQVYSDAKWKDWDTVLQYPVIIEDGCTLTVKDSHLEIPLERMVLEQIPPFNVSSGASLVIEGSTIEVTEDTLLRGALFDAYSDLVSTPLMWRVVHLVGAEEPVLEFDVEYIRGAPYIVAAAQRTPRDPLEPLAIIEPIEMTPLEWSKVRVSLEEFIGSMPRLVIFIHNSDVGEALVSNVTVTDDGGPLRLDEYAMGDQDDDGWFMGHLYDFIDMVDRGSWRINRLIDGHGDLTVRDSRILSLPGLERDHANYYPQRAAVGGGGLHVTLQKAPDEGGINVTGDVTFVSSEVAYAPIELGGLYASFEDCDFVGDCEMLTISKPEAIVRDCTFEFRQEEGPWGVRPVEKDTWMLALERTVKDPLVAGCTFKGQGRGAGLVVNHQRADLFDLSFSGLGTGIWVHGADPSMRYDALSSQLSYDGSCRVEYLETAEVRVRVDGDDAPRAGYAHSYWTRRSVPDVPGLERFYFPIHETNFAFLFCLPLTVVTPGGGVNELEELTTYISPNWEEGKYVTLDPRESSHYVWFEGDSGSQENGWNNIVDYAIHPGVEPGSLTIGFRLLHEYHHMADMYLNISFDGDVTDRIWLNSPEYDWSESPVQWVNLTLDVPVGPHELNITSGAVFEEYSQLVVEMESLESSIFRVGEGSTADDLEDWLQDVDFSIILVDPDVRLGGIDYTRPLSYYYFFMTLYTWEGSEISFDRLDFNQESWGVLDTEGSGTVEILSLSTFWLHHRVSNSSLSVGGIECVYYEGHYSNATVAFLDGCNSSYMIVEAENGTDVRMEGIGMFVNEGVGVSLEDSEAILRDCDFINSSGSGVHISTLGNSSITVDDCHLEGLYLFMASTNSSDEWTLTNCTFEGRGAYLALTHDTASLAEGEDVSDISPGSGLVAGNTFEGEGAALVFEPYLRNTILGENQLVGEARAYALYHPEVQWEHWDYYGYGFITLDSLNFHRSLGTPWEDIEHLFDHMVDVTEDPLDDADPGMVPAVIRMSYGSDGRPEGPVVGFRHVAIASEIVTLYDVDWPPAHEEVEELQRDFRIHDNWWKR